MADKVFRLLAGFLVMTFLARHLGPEEFGIYAYIQAFTMIFLGIYSLGIDGILVKSLLSEQHKREEVLRTAFAIKIGGSLIGATTVTLIALYFEDGTTRITIILLAWSLIFQSTNVFDYQFQAEVKGKKTATAQSIAIAISSIIKIIAILLSADLAVLAGLLSLDAIILSVSYTSIFLRDKGRLPTPKLNLDMAKSLLAQSWSLIFSGTAVLVQARVDQIMLKHYSEPSELGHYAVALMCIEAIAFPAAIIKQSLTPAVVNAKNADEALYRSRMANLYRLSFLLFVASALATLVLVAPAVEFFFGPAYAPAVGLLTLYSFRLFFSYATVARSTYMMIENLLPYALLSLLLSTAINIAANLFLIPALHAQGAILATLISFAAPVFLFDLMNRRMHTNYRMMMRGIITPHKLTMG